MLGLLVYECYSVEGHKSCPPRWIGSFKGFCCIRIQQTNICFYPVFKFKSQWILRNRLILTKCFQQTTEICMKRVLLQHNPPHIARIKYTILRFWLRSRQRIIEKSWKEFMDDQSRMSWWRRARTHWRRRMICRCHMNFVYVPCQMAAACRGQNTRDYDECR